MDHIETIVPLHAPVVAALTAADPEAAFLDFMRDSLVPGAWEYPIDNGFAWIPHRLRHTIECAADEHGRLVARSEFVLVDDADVGQALSMVCYLNQRSFGGAAWFDQRDGSVRLTSSVRLDVDRWWNALLFTMAVKGAVGICEHLAPRLADRVGGTLARAPHPELGWRETPDEFCDMWMFPTSEPEAATGLWWAASEVTAFRRVAADGATSASGSIAWPDDTLPGRLCTLGASGVVPHDHGRVSFGISEVDHPDLGAGLQFLLSSSVQFAEEHSEDGERHHSRDSLFVANAVNMVNALEPHAALSIAGWTLWGGQLHHATFVPGESARNLQFLAQPAVGEIVGQITGGLLANIAPLGRILAADDNSDVEWWHTDEVTWRGVPESAGYEPLLVDASAVAPVTDGLPVNQLFGEPLDITDELWGFPHRRMVSMGVLDPSTVGIGTIEIAIDYTHQLGLLTERVRHPSTPSLQLWAVIDFEGFLDRAEFVEPLLARLQWTRVDWVRIDDPDVTDAALRGLRHFELNMFHDARRQARRRLDSLASTWNNGGTGGALGDDWPSIVTDPLVVDHALAHLRSAWEGAKAHRRGENPTHSTETIVARLREEIDTRRAGMLGHHYLWTNLTFFENGAWVTPTASNAVADGPIHVITAWNPGAQRPSEAENRDANERLHDELVRRGHSPFPAVGSSSTADHSEESWAVTGMSTAAAIEVGAAFEQLAVFRVTATEQQVWSVTDGWVLRRPLP